ncbi:MAG: cytochrome P450 family protein [Isosphaeraceae bacterium]
MNPVREVELISPAFKANPYPFYAQLRAEAPVCRMTMSDRQTAWLVTRYDDVVTVLKDERFTTERAKAQTPEQAAKVSWVPKAFKALERNMLAVDAPDHTRLRGLVHKAFTPRLIDMMQMRIQSLTDRLLDAASGAGRMDLIRDYALPLPTTIIALMLGVPAGDRHRFHRWSSALMATSSSTWGKLKAIPSAMGFLGYIRKLVKTREADPRDDLTSALVSAREAGDRLSEDELMAMIFLLLIAGHETTVNLIGNGVLALLEHPEQLDRLRREPELIKPAVEEFLRFDGPVQIASERYPREDVTIAEVTIPRGEMVFAVLGSANRDERQFERPEVLDITREPNRHLAFGLGAHYCLGAPLARMEGQIAINTLLCRLPELRLGVPREKLRRRPSMGLHGLESLPLLFARRARDSAPGSAVAASL